MTKLLDGLVEVTDHTGIVLHSFFPKRHKIALLDDKVGRIDSVIYKQVGAPSAVLSYRLVRQRGAYMLEDVQVEYMPLALAREDILFLHHIIELCYKFIPVGSCVRGIFDLFTHLYALEISSLTRQYKKFFLFCLLSTLGIQPSSQPIRPSKYARLLQMSIDTKLSESLDLESEKELDRWLEYCIAEYAEADALKTVYFLIKNRVA